MMRRREFISLLGALVVWPPVARSQPAERLRRVGILLPATAGDSEYPMLVKAFVEGLQQFGWTDGGNIRIDIRWAGGGADTNRRYAQELVTLAPDVIMAAGNASERRCFKPHGQSRSSLRSFPTQLVPDS